MRFLMIVKLPAQHKSEAGAMPEPERYGAMMKYNEELAKAGVLLSLAGLHPTSKGARIAFADGKPMVTAGPFTETNEIIGGFWMIDVKSPEEALEWAKRVPAEEEIIELRQIFDKEDFLVDAEQVGDYSVIEEALEKAGAIE